MNPELRFIQQALEIYFSLASCVLISSLSKLPSTLRSRGLLNLQLAAWWREKMVDGGWWIPDPGVGAAMVSIGFARGGNCKIKGRRASKLPEQPDWCREWEHFADVIAACETGSFLSLLFFFYLNKDTPCLFREVKRVPWRTHSIWRAPLRLGRNVASGWSCLRWTCRCFCKRQTISVKSSWILSHRVVRFVSKWAP